jgi:uncharacterized membrane protein YphA (DoxX/SURF4 family)
LNNIAATLIQNSWMELVFRWILGLTFIYASYHKILAPGDFAKIIYGYGLFPAVIINLIAIVVPFVELIAGLALIGGIYPRAAAMILNAMLVFFIIILSYNLLRGHEFDCGCFAPESFEFIATTELTLFRDFVYLALGLQVFFYHRSRRLSLTCGLQKPAH